MNRLQRLRRRISERLFPDPLEHLYHKYQKYTMVPKECFLASLHLAERVKNLSGSIVECGVWRGGVSAATAEVLGPDRAYFLFDSFEGLPPAREIDGVAALAWQADKQSPHYHDNCAAEESWAREAMGLSGARNVKLLKGWFSEGGFQSANLGPIALLRLDADWYESTKVCLESLYDKVVEGGVIVLDDYYSWDGCSIALHEYLAAKKSPDRIRLAYTVGIGGGCYLLKGGR